MLIKKVQGTYIIATAATGAIISPGDVVGFVQGEVVLSDKDSGIPAEGIAKHVESDTITVQTAGKFSNSNAGDDYWLGTSGTIVSAVPTSGIIQKIGKRTNTSEILITIDRTVIVL